MSTISFEELDPPKKEEREWVFSPHNCGRLVVSLKKRIKQNLAYLPASQDELQAAGQESSEERAKVRPGEVAVEVTLDPWAVFFRLGRHFFQATLPGTDGGLVVWLGVLAWAMFFRPPWFGVVGSPELGGFHWQMANQKHG